MATRNMPSKNKRSRKNTLLKTYGPFCCWCGRELPPERLTIEHLVPLCEGGRHHLPNLRLACFPCNYGRHH